MSLVDGTLTQTAVWTPSDNGYNPDGTPKRSSPIDISCRVELYQKLLTDSTGKEVVSSSRLFTKSPVKPLDFIELDGVKRRVISSSPVIGLWGSLEHYEVVI